MTIRGVSCRRKYGPMSATTPTALLAANLKRGSARNSRSDNHVRSAAQLIEKIRFAATNGVGEVVGVADQCDA
jgi:hypothetical protein